MKAFCAGLTIFVLYLVAVGLEAIIIGLTMPPDQFVPLTLQVAVLIAVGMIVMAIFVWTN